jgi:nicotinamidase-related amidase
MLVIHTREDHRPNPTDAPPTKLARGHLSCGLGNAGPIGRVLIRGEYGHPIIPEFYPLSTKPVIDKSGKDAFYEIDLALILANRGIKSLIVCGVIPISTAQTYGALTALGPPWAGRSPSGLIQPLSVAAR